MGSPPSLTASEEEFWRAFALVLHTLPQTLENDLQAGADISSPEYAALQGMADDHGNGLRINELAAIVGLSASRASRLAEGLVARGEARRQQCEDDRRSNRVTITQKGLDRLKAAWPCHLASVRRRILDHIDSGDYLLLTQALRTIVDDSPDPNGTTSSIEPTRRLSA